MSTLYNSRLPLTQHAEHVHPGLAGGRRGAELGRAVVVLPLAGPHGGGRVRGAGVARARRPGRGHPRVRTRGVAAALRPRRGPGL